jgi:hypothetical protein
MNIFVRTVKNTAQKIYTVEILCKEQMEEDVLMRPLYASFTAPKAVQTVWSNSLSHRLGHDGIPYKPLTLDLIVSLNFSLIQICSIESHLIEDVERSKK